MWGDNAERAWSNECWGETLACRRLCKYGVVWSDGDSKRILDESRRLFFQPAVGSRAGKRARHDTGGK